MDLIVLYSVLTVVLCTLAVHGFDINVQDVNEVVPAVASGRRLRTCGGSDVPECRVRAPRDIIFLVDASDSMDPSQFYGNMLDYVQDLWCTLNINDLNRGALITFGDQVKIQVPFREYSPTEWFSAIELLRSDSTSCCKCCTPTAEAFQAARILLEQNPSPDVSGIPVVRICFVITDGDPWQNTQGSISSGKPVLDPKQYWLFPKYKPAFYRYSIVPSEAGKLKDLPDGGRPVRVMLVGVPNKFGQPPEQGYFSGIPDPKNGNGKNNLTQCITRGKVRDCVIMRFPPFPIVSLPIDKNLFNAGSWNVGELIQETVDDLCEILPTPAPTTRAPTHLPSVTPTKSPTLAPTFGPTMRPTKRPTNFPTKTPTLAPSTRTPTLSPTETQKFYGLDLFLFLDRSKSMRWRFEDCRTATGSNPNADNDRVCWQLFLYFARRMVKRSTELIYDGVNPIGWQAGQDNPEKGLRVWIYGFACANQQKVPLTFRIGEKINNPADFEAAMAEASAMIPDGGTCPGATIERAVGQIMANYDNRLYKAAIMLTDGVFYDQPRPQVASTGLFYFGALTYSLGIAIPLKGNNQGLTPSEIKDQAVQLLAFAENDPSRVRNFGVEGINLLDQIAASLVNQLPIDVAKHLPKILLKPYFCYAFTTNERCLNKDPSSFPTANYCNWVPNNPANFQGNGVCRDKCPHTTQSKCAGDSKCQWIKGYCRPKGL